jgi:hypothetical protein
MLCIKTVKSLSKDELRSLNALIDTYYELNTLLENDIVIYSKTKDEVIGCVCVNPKKGIVSNLCVKIEHMNTGIETNLIQMAKNISSTSLIVSITSNSIEHTHYTNEGFVYDGEHSMVLQK